MQWVHDHILSSGMRDREQRRRRYKSLMRSCSTAWALARPNIWRMPRARTGRAKPVALISGSLQQVDSSFSPGGRRIAFGSDRSGMREIWSAIVTVR
jgi:hypothetical protein